MSEQWKISIISPVLKIKNPVELPDYWKISDYHCAVPIAQRGCTMGRSLCVTLGYIHMVKVEKHILISSKLFFCGKFEDEVVYIGYNVFFNEINNYHPNIKLTI